MFDIDKRPILSLQRFWNLLQSQSSKTNNDKELKNNNDKDLSVYNVKNGETGRHSQW